MISVSAASLNGRVFVYELSGCGFESSCSHSIGKITTTKVKRFLKTNFDLTQTWKLVFIRKNGQLRTLAQCSHIIFAFKVSE